MHTYTNTLGIAHIYIYTQVQKHSKIQKGAKSRMGDGDHSTHGRTRTRLGGKTVLLSGTQDTQSCGRHLKICQQLVFCIFVFCILYICIFVRFREARSLNGEQVFGNFINFGIRKVLDF